MDQSRIETAKALNDLREYCASPKCNAWKTVRSLQSPTRFAEFIEGKQHSENNDSDDDSEEADHGENVVHELNETFVKEMDDGNCVDENDELKETLENSLDDWNLDENFYNYESNHRFVQFWPRAMFLSDGKEGKRIYNLDN